MAKTVEHFHEQLETLASLTLQDLQDLSVAALRRKLSEAGITGIDRDGTIIAVNSARKAELVSTVQELTRQRRIITVTAPDLLVTTEEDLDLKELNDTPIWAEPVTVAQKYVDELVKHTKAQWDTQAQNWKPPSAAVYALASQMATKLMNLGRLDTQTSMTTESKLRFRSQVSNLMSIAIKTYSLDWFGTELKNNYDRFHEVVYTAMREMSAEKRDNQVKNLSARNHNVVSVDLTEMLSFANTVLSNLDENTPASKWKLVSCALAVVTGRRMSELHSSGQFEVIGSTANIASVSWDMVNHGVMFSGQLKTKDSRELVPYPVPVLVKPFLVVNAIAWLVENGKRVNDAKTVNNRYAKDLSEFVKHEWFLKTLPDLYSKDADRPTTQKRCTYKALRQLYALKAADVFCPEHMTDKQFKATILGHGEHDLSTVNSYESDFRLSSS